MPAQTASICAIICHLQGTYQPSAPAAAHAPPVAAAPYVAASAPNLAPTPSSGYVAGLAAWGQTAEAVVVSWESDVWQESAYSFKVGVAREGGDMSWSYPACQASGQGAFFHVLTAADGLECGESYEILVMQGDAQTETIVARTLACDGSDDDAACVCDCGSDYEEDDCADSTSWYYKKSKDQCGLQALVWGVPTKLQNSLSRPIPSRFG